MRGDFAFTLSERVTARDLYHLTRNHLCLVARQEQDRFGNILGCDKLTHWDYGKHGFFQFLVYPSRLGGAGGDTVYGDTVLCHLEGNATGKGFYGGFACAVGYLTCEYLSCIGGKIDNSAVISAVINEFSCHKNGTSDIYGESVINHTLSDAFNCVDALHISVGCIVD